jgi:hypothetical protein
VVMLGTHGDDASIFLSLQSSVCAVAGQKLAVTCNLAKVDVRSDDDPTDRFLMNEAHP